MNLQEAFTSRLRRHREWSGISLDEIAAATRIQRQLLEAFERNDLSEWPRGLYARACIRAYAAALGLEPAETVDEFCRLYPQGDRRARPVIEEIAAIVASPSEYKPDLPNEANGGRRATDDVIVAAQTPSRLDSARRFLRSHITSRFSAPRSARRATP